jgi:hypothetical protein
MYEAPHRIERTTADLAVGFVFYLKSGAIAATVHWLTAVALIAGDHLMSMTRIDVVLAALRLAGKGFRFLRATSATIE